MTATVVALFARKIEDGVPTEALGRWILDLFRDQRERTVQLKVACAETLLRLCERIKRIDEGLPLLELAKD